MASLTQSAMNNKYKRNLDNALQIVLEGEKVLQTLESKGYEIPQYYYDNIKRIKDIKYNPKRTGITDDTLDHIRYLFNVTQMSKRIKEFNSDMKAMDRAARKTEKREKEAARKAEIKAIREEEREVKKQQRAEDREEVRKIRQLGRDMADIITTYTKYKLQHDPKNRLNISENDVKYYLNQKTIYPDQAALILSNDNSILAANIKSYANTYTMDGIVLEDMTIKEMEDMVQSDDDRLDKLYRMVDFIESAKSHMPITALKFKSKKMKELKRQTLETWGNMAHVTTLKNQGWTDDEIRFLEEFIDSSSLWQSIRSQGYESETEVEIKQDDGSVRTFTAHKGRNDIANFLKELRAVVQETMESGNDDILNNFITKRLRN